MPPVLSRRNYALKRLLAREEARRERCRNFWFTVLVVVIVCSIAFKARGQDVEAKPEGPKWDIRALIAKYNCKWIAEKRKTHSDEELEAMARQLHLPEIVIKMAKRCPK